LLLTVPVVAENVVLLWPAGTDTLAGTVTRALLLLSDTEVMAAAFWFSVTVQVLEALLPNVDGVHDKDVSCAGALIVRAKVLEPPFSEAVSVALWFEFTAPTVALKVVLLCPTVMVALPGTVTLALLLARAMVAPPEGAVAVKLTVQVAVPGAFTVAGEQLKLLSWAGATRLSVAGWLWPLRVAVTVALWLLLTVPVVAEKVALLWPA
jgi:hypothetical protein